MKAYHFLTIVKFDRGINTYQVNQQISLKDSQPVSKLTKTNDSFYKDFDKYELFHETKRNKRGRAYGYEEAFAQYIEQKTFNCYLWETNNIIIFEANKSAVNGSIRRITKQYGKDVFELKREHVDFGNILRKAANITGGWFGEFEGGNVTSVGLFGNHVDLSSDYNRYQAAGELSSLTVEVRLGGNMHKFMITKDRVIVLYENMSTEKDLDLLVQIYNELLL